MSHKVFDFTVSTPVPSDRVLAAATTFTHDRLRLWPTISSKHYTVHALHETWCDCTEGTGPVWERNHWDWSVPGVVTGTVLASNAHIPPGTEVMRVTARKGGGSHIEVHKERTFTGLLGHTLQGVLGLCGGSAFFQKSCRRTINILEAELAQQAAPST
ncbi:MAG: hypothetical protein NVS2B16_16810 [Chloroflexota bacterium]